MIDLAEMPDELIVLPMLFGLGYAIVIQTGKLLGLSELWPSLFGPRVRPLGISCIAVGVGLILASAKYGALQDAAAHFYGVAGCLLLFTGLFLLFRRTQA